MTLEPNPTDAEEQVITELVEFIQERGKTFSMRTDKREVLAQILLPLTSLIAKRLAGIRGTTLDEWTDTAGLRHFADEVLIHLLWSAGMEVKEQREETLRCILISLRQDLQEMFASEGKPEVRDKIS